MSENSEHNAGESNENHVTKPELNAEGINQGRRALARAVLVGTPVILTLASKPSLALDKMATVSGQLSGNLSQADTGGTGGGTSSGGYSPLHWAKLRADNNDSYGCSFNGSPIKGGKQFKDVFGGSNNTKLNDILRPILAGTLPDLTAHAVAALLNSCTTTLSYGYTGQDVVVLYNSYINGTQKERDALWAAFDYLNRLS